VASDLLSQTAGWPGVEAALVKVRAGGDSFEEFVVDQLEELERLRAALEERERAFQADRRKQEAAAEELKAEWQALKEQRQCLQRDAEQIEEHAQRLEKSQAELEEARGEFSRMREAGMTETGTATTALLSQLESVERDRSELQQQLTSSRAQIGRLADLEQQRAALEQELGDARGQISRLADANAELAKVRGELAAARAELLAQSGRSANASESDGAWRDQVRDLQHERAMLEAELETVRRRVVEMAETASSEKQRTAQERSEWSKEFKQLRKLLEVQTLSPAKTPAPAAAVPAAAAQPAAGGGDPILESVMAQFDMLQKDIARRRTGGKKTSK
jgi:chromosome segregation ATPase